MNLSTLVGQISARWRGEDLDELPATPETSTTTSTTVAPVTLSARPARPAMMPSTRKSKCIHAFIPRLNTDLTEAVEHLKAGSAIFVNLQNVSGERGQRVIDVMLGVCLGIDGTCQQVGDRIYLLAPAEFSLTSDEPMDATRVASDGFMIRERLTPTSASSLHDDSDPSPSPRLRFG